VFNEVLRHEYEILSQAPCNEVLLGIGGTAPCILKLGS